MGLGVGFVPGGVLGLFWVGHYYIQQIQMGWGVELVPGGVLDLFWVGHFYI